MASDLLPPLDALIVVMSVVFALSVVVGVIVGRARLRKPATRPGPAVRKESSVGAPVMGPAPPATVPPEAPLLSRRWEEDRRSLQPRRGTRPG